MMFDISILIPGIRTHNWPYLLETIKASCAKYSYEVIFAGPFPPETYSNVQYYQTYACPSVAGQLGATLCRGRLILHSVDDAHFLPGVIDACVPLLENRKDVVNTRYTENDNYSGKTFSLDYWRAHHHDPLKLPGIPEHYKIALHFLMDYSYFKELGGFDCSYEYMNFNLHDLMFRVQYDGGRLIDSPTDVTNCDHLVGGEHAIIESAAVSDGEIFNRKYSNPNALHPEMIRINYDNWRQQPEVWPRRFKKMYKSYQEMVND